MLGFFKDMRILNRNDLHDEEHGQEKDRKYFAIIAVFAAVIIITIIRAQADHEIAEQISNLRFNVADGILLALAAGGYFILKTSRRK